jgi:hypothetical protein
MTGTTATETGRTIEQILAIRVRAARIRVHERIKALVDEQFAVEQQFAGTLDEQKHAELLEAKRLADEDLMLMQREVAAQKGEPVEPVQYDSASPFMLKRYAVALIEDNPELDPAAALTQAHKDEHARFEDWYARHHDDSDLDEDDEDDQ